MFCTCGVEEEKRRVCGGGGTDERGIRGRIEGERRETEGGRKRGRLDYLGATMTATGVYWVRSGLVWMDRDS